jgi:hypothetical protein
VSDEKEHDDKRVQEVIAELLARRIEESLIRAEEALAAWRHGDIDVLGANAEVLRHAARVAALSARVARAGTDGPTALLRDAVSTGIIDDAEFVRLTGVPIEEVAAPQPLDAEAGRATWPELPPKRVVAERLLAGGPILVHLDARRDGVDVPESHRGESRLVLRFGHGLTPPIPDLALGDDSLTGTLTFHGNPHRCNIPWTSVYAMFGEDGRGLVWSEDMPPDVEREDVPPPDPKKPKGRGHLRLV